jgi:hypothetical protein
MTFEFSLAYIDPGTGTLVVQLLIAAALSSLIFIRSLLSRLLSFFGGRKERESHPSEAVDHKTAA